MCEAEKIGVEELENIAIFGFDGAIRCSLQVHPDKEHLIFPLGCKVSIMNTVTSKQQFLCGHTNQVSKIAVSKSGDLIASGQMSYMGFRAFVIIWDWKTRMEKTRYEIHKGLVESLSFSSDENSLISLGGPDDQMIVVWDIKKNAATCTSKAASEISGNCKSVRCLQRRDAIFVSAGDDNLRLWCIDKVNRKLRVHDVIVGRSRRSYTGMCISSTDDFLYAGTMSGDIVKVQLNCHHEPDVIERDKAPVLVGVYGRHVAKRPYGKDCEKYLNGVRDVLLLENKLVIGAGDGTVELVQERNKIFKDYPSPTVPQLKTLKRTKVIGAVTSLQLLETNEVIIGTEACEMYFLNLQSFEIKLFITCNTETVYDVAFPPNLSLVFATASYQSVRIWSVSKKLELLRIMVPNFSAAALVFSHDGKSIVSAWNDGVIRAFTPLSGSLIYAIPNAHNKGCSALTISSCGKMLVSGGVEGQVRVWKIEAIRQSLIGVLKEHTASIGSVCFNKFNTEIVSSSSDGTCIIWDIVRLVRRHVLYANTQFTCAQFFPTGVQILATGTDRRVSYWEVYDASLVRDVEASKKGPVNCVTLNKTGEHFISVGHDQIVKMWDYQTGQVISAGYGHASPILTCAFSPCGKIIVTGDKSGALFIWKVPEKHWPQPGNDPFVAITRKMRKASLSGRKPPEHINKLETSRSNKDVHISKCPAVDLQSQPDMNEDYMKGL
ncbi:cilia- and flagella-associated protein 52 [Bradysia coprophila]|uniref:cilia- and flagella-associated protein 52 n=1 Tax=Bradysia coprophila TaxID=38358 RepID=UPI00187DB11F|nr:cilia- and flagella-associated protein 52 [Bradysia coprophila]